MRSPQTLSLEDRQVLAAWAADGVETVLAIYSSAVPGDARVIEAIDQTRAFASGDLAVADAIRRRGAEAGGAARTAPTAAAKAVAYAAEQAAAVAHMGAHALGAAGYGAKAAGLASADNGDGVVLAWAYQRVAQASGTVANALASLPLLGTIGAGPLGPGRLSNGHVGLAIRAIQAHLNVCGAPPDLRKRTPELTGGSGRCASPPRLVDPGHRIDSHHRDEPLASG
jgi:hypothetical protein